MAKLDLHLIKCPMHEISTVLQCQMCCDWYWAKDLAISNEITCGYTDEVLPIIHRTIDIDLDIDIIRQPQEPVLTPCDPRGCHIQKGEGNG